MSCLSKLAAAAVAAVWLRPPPRRFHDLAVFQLRLRPRHSADNFPGLGPLPGFVPKLPPGVLRPGYPPGVSRPYSDVSVEVHMTRGPTPGSFRLQGFSPSWRFSPSSAFRSRRPVPLMGFTLQSVPPSQVRTPFGAVTLLLFLTSHSSALRTRRPRCPAAPGCCSPRGSVPARAEARPGRCSHGIRGASSEHSSNAVGSASRPLPSCAFDRPTRRSNRPALQGFPERSNPRDLATPPTLMRFATGTCPRALPTTVASQFG